MFVPKPICYQCAEPIMEKIAHTQRPVNTQCHKCGKAIMTDRVQDKP